jgi:inner membrane protein
MDNLTHSLIGLAAAKAGLEKLSPGTTTLCVLAANAPDGDILALLVGGRWAYLQHHRGITHSIVGSLALALALPLVFYFGDRLIAKVRQREPRLKPKGLLIASLLVTATHPIMDWTNNYGMRFLLPWNPRWFYGDFVFIIDPFIWLVLGGAAFLLTSKTKKHIIVWVVISLVPSLIVLVGRAGTLTTEMSLRLVWIAALIVLVILYRRKIVERHGSNIAIAALVLVTLYCAGLATTHALALRQAKFEAASIASTKHEQIVKVAAMPTMADPLDWLCVMETDRATYKFNTSLLHRTQGPSNVIRYEKPFGPAAEAVAQAERDGRAEIFLGFARFPVVRVAGDDCLTQTLVQFADLRYTEPGKGRGTFSLDVPVECPSLDNQAK